MINIFILRCAESETQDYYFADRPIRNNYPDCPYNKELSCLRLIDDKNILPGIRKTDARIYHRNFQKKEKMTEKSLESKQFLILLKNVYLHPEIYLIRHCFTKRAYNKTTNKTSQLHRDTQVIRDLLVLENRSIICYTYLNGHTFPYEAT